MNNTLEVYIFAWLSLWMTEGLLIRVGQGENIPWWSIAIQSGSIVAFLHAIFV